MQQPLPPRDFTNPIEKEIAGLQLLYDHALKNNEGPEALSVLRERIKILKTELSISRKKEWDQ